MAEPRKSILPSEVPLPPRVDLWIAGVFLLLGLSIAMLSLAMPTFKEQKGEIYTAPGLVPGFYGLVIAALSVWLGVRAIGRRAQGALAEPDASRGDVSGLSNLRLAFCAALCLFFVAVLIGRMPFWLASTIFVTLFIVLFEWDTTRTLHEKMRGVATALVQGIITGVAVVLVFEKIFLVRLP